MKLEEYLHRVETCPDEEVEFNSRKMSLLQAEYGIYDNLPILLGVDYRKITNDLIGSRQSHEQFSGEYELKQTITSEGTETSSIFHYVPGTVLIKVNDRKISEKTAIETFNVGIMLHPYQDKEIENTHWMRAIAKVLVDFGKYAVKNNLPLCLPNSVGSRYIQTDYSSRIVYHNSERILDGLFKQMMGS
jgi:hypothetical protein